MNADTIEQATQQRDSTAEDAENAEENALKKAATLYRYKTYLRVLCVLCGEGLPVV